MEGVFIRKKFSFSLFWLFLCGLSFIGLYIFLNIVDPQATSALLIFLISGIVICLSVIIARLHNRGAYIHLEEDAIRAKYHWFGKLNCKTDDVAFALAQINTLTILRKSGKCHTIMGIENPWPLAAAIRKQIFAVESEEIDALRHKLESVQKAQKNMLIAVLSGLALIFANIFIAVILTDSKEMEAFDSTDWILFSVMGVIELLTVLITFCFAKRCGSYQIHAEQLEHRLKGAYILSQPLPAGNIKRIYTNPDYRGRILVCGYPDSACVYFCVQEFTNIWLLETVYTSEVFEGEDGIVEEIDLDWLIDITDWYL